MRMPCTLEELQISAIVPAYNEAGNILNVLNVLKQVPAIKEIIVISDGSTDSTADLAANFGGVKVIELSQNIGKTKAVIRGVEEAMHWALLFCDADLVNLNQKHFADMFETYCEGFAMVIMDKGGQPWVFRSLLRSPPAVSGTRILDLADFMKVPFKETDRFQFENRIDEYFLANGLSIAVSPADEVHDTRKFVKYPFWRGLLLDIRGGWNVLASDGIISIPGNLRLFRRMWRIAQTPSSRVKR